MAVVKSDTIALREYIEAQMNALCTKMQVWESAHSEKHELELGIRNTERDSVRNALDLNSKEISRRLDILNGEADRLRIMQATYVPREIYEASIKDVRQALELSSRDISSKFDAVNSDIEKLRENMSTYLPRELHEVSVKDISRRLDGSVSCDEFKAFRVQNKEQIEKMTNELDRLRLVEANLRGQVIAYSATIGLALSIITFILNKFL